MRPGSLRAAMTMRAAVERDMADGDTPRGNAGAPDWQPHLPALVCRAWFPVSASGGSDERPERVVVQGNPLLLAPMGTDITEGDRVTAITHRNGDAFATGPFRVENVGPRGGDLLVTLERRTEWS